MEIGIGVALALAVGAMATVTGFERDRAFYPTVLMVIASCYLLFAVMAESLRVLSEEAALSVVFAVAAVVGFRSNLWIVVAALAAHALFDLGHGVIVDNAGVPSWWQQFCLGYDLTAAAYLAWRLLRLQTLTLRKAGENGRVDHLPRYFGIFRTQRLSTSTPNVEPGGADMPF